MARAKSVDNSTELTAFADESDPKEGSKVNFVIELYSTIGIASVAARAPGDFVHGDDEETDLAWVAAVRSEEGAQADLLRDIIGNLFRPVSLDPAWLTPNVLELAQSIYDERAFDRMPVLADTLEEAGCDNADILNHCRGPGPHVRGDWVIDLVLGKS